MGHITLYQVTIAALTMIFWKVQRNFSFNKNQEFQFQFHTLQLELTKQHCKMASAYKNLPSSIEDQQTKKEITFNLQQKIAEEFDILDKPKCWYKLDETLSRKNPQQRSEVVTMGVIK
jgi:hypothetical protein